MVESVVSNTILKLMLPVLPTFAIMGFLGQDASAKPLLANRESESISLERCVSTFQGAVSKGTIEISSNPQEFLRHLKTLCSTKLGQSLIGGITSKIETNPTYKAIVITPVLTQEWRKAASRTILPLEDDAGNHGIEVIVPLFPDSSFFVGCNNNIPIMNTETDVVALIGHELFHIKQLLDGRLNPTQKSPPPNNRAICPIGTVHSGAWKLGNQAEEAAIEVENLIRVQLGLTSQRQEY